MSMENSAELQIQIFRKNNSVIRWKVSVGGKNMEPLGMAANFETETIFSGESLLLNMYSSYYPYSETKHWLQETGRYFHVIDPSFQRSITTNPLASPQNGHSKPVGNTNILYTCAMR